MQILTITKCFLAEALPSTMAMATPLTFNPIKLALLVAWVYLSMYCVQRIEFSSLVSKKYKSIANFITLFTGPIALLALIINNAAKKSSEEDESFLVKLKKQLQNLSGLSSILHFKDNAPIKLLDSSGRSLTEIYGHTKGMQQDNHILNMTSQIIADALEQRATDILIDPQSETISSVRFRVDGVLREVDQLDVETTKAVVNSIKAVARMDIAEKRRPQDGSFIAKTEDKTVSFRAATAGVLNGEKLALRALNQDASMCALTNIGLTEKQRMIIENAAAKPSGMILMCGPTGSGKTTTLYGILNNIDLFTRNVITIEDPIEYVLTNASQIEVNPKADITFASSLRSVLRQDPDIICVGEIRDSETATIALQAAQTGHLVLATVHSNSSASALVRLLDLEVTPLMLASGLTMIVSQRLIRKLCKNCRIPAELKQSQIHDFRRRKINYKNFLQATGCEKCAGTGYYGRTAIYDILVLDEKIKNAIATNTLSVEQLRNEGDKRGKSNLQKQALKLAVSGITSVEEIARIVG